MIPILRVRDGNGEVVDIPAIVGPEGQPGNGIVGIELIDGNHEAGKIDTYRITFDDNTFYDYEVYNGADGEGVGDMVARVYDPQGKAQDVFKYTDDKIADINVTAKINAHNTLDSNAHADIRSAASDAAYAAAVAQSTADAAAAASAAAQAAFNALKTESWTFTLEDGSEVTKAVYVR